MMEKERISTYITEETEIELRIKAAKKRMSMSKYIEMLILKDLEENGEEDKAKQ